MITAKDIKKLKNNAMDFAMIMDDCDIEQVIVEFVKVKSIRDKERSND